MRTNLTDIVLWQSLAIFLIIGALMGVAVSLLLIFKPHLMERVNRVANRWVSTRRLNRLFDRSISIERWFYRHHRLLGIFVVLGACYILVYFGLLFDKAIALQRLSGNVPVLLLDILLDILLDALVLTALLGAAVALIIGLFVWLRPSLLRGIEKEANQWVSTRSATRMLDMPHGEVDRFVARHAQRVGWLLLLGSLYLFFVLFRWLV